MFQASDRLTTLARSGARWDDSANKSLIVRVPLAVLFVGYSGNAYIAGAPTDTWLASCLTGLAISSAHSLADGRSELEHMNVGQVPERIARALESQIEAMSPQEKRTFSLSVQVLGIAVRRNDTSPRAVIFEVIARPSLREAVEVRHERRRDWTGRRPNGVMPTAAVLATPRLRAFERAALERVFRQPEVVASPAAIENTLDNSVLALSRLRGGIGHDLMSLSFFPGDAPVVFIKYLPHDKGYSPIQGPDGTAAPVSCTPWFLSPAGTMPPLELTEGDVGIGGESIRMNVEITGQTTSVPFVMGIRAQPRRLPPG